MARVAGRDDERLTTVGLLFESAAALRQVFQHRLGAEESLSSQSFDVLIRLARSPDHRLRMSELAAQTSLTPSGLTRSVDRLRRQGLVERRACPDDRRGAYAVLTSAGKRLMDRAVPAHVDHVNEILDEVFSPDEEQALASLLRQLRDHLHARRAEWGVGSGDGETCEGDD